MKKIILVRHAKSGWDNPDLQDFERPLNKRGKTDAPIMAQILEKYKVFPDLLISSPAVRALTTANIFAETINYPPKKILTDKGIYEKGARYIIKLIANLNNSVNTVVVFGHNPDMTSLASYFVGDYFDNVPTCGIVAIEKDVDDWSKIEDGNSKLLFYEYPKKIKSNVK